MPGSPAYLVQSVSITESLSKNAREGVYITTLIHKAGVTVSDQIARGADVVAGNDRATAQHSLIDYHAERIVDRGQHHKICSRVDGWQLRLVHKTEKAHAIGYAELDRFELETRSQRTLAGEDEKRVAPSRL
jgi:hypothetical protein